MNKITATTTRRHQKISEKILLANMKLYMRLFSAVIGRQESRVMKRLGAFTEGKLNKIESVIGLKSENQIVAREMRPIYIAIQQNSADSLNAEFNEFEYAKATVPLEDMKKLLNAKIIKYADLHSASMAKYVDKTTAMKIRRTIEIGLEEGEGIRAITKRISRDVFGDLKVGYRSRMVARTESHGLIQNGSFQAAKESSVVKTKGWSSAADARPTHGDANGQVVKVFETYMVGGYKMDYPGDSSYGAALGELINCRCASLYGTARMKLKRPATETGRVGEVIPAEMEPLRISKDTAQMLKNESGSNSYMFDIHNQAESSMMTKQRIVENLSKRLEDNKDFVEYLNTLLPPKPDNPIALQHWLEGKAERANQIVNEWIQRWAGTSGDGSPKAVAMQMAARQEFGLSKSYMGHVASNAQADAIVILRQNGKAMRAFLRAQYDATQQFFKNNGIQHLTGYRGMGFDRVIPEFRFNYNPVIDQKIMKMQPLSSFSTKMKTARGFTAGKEYRMVSQAKVPVSRILSTCQTGFGCKSEAEFVVLGAQDSLKFITGRDTLGTITEMTKLFVDFKGIPPIPIWKPVMTQAEADIWAKGSKYADNVFLHSTSKTSASKITSGGFKLNQKTVGGKYLGDGVYVTDNKTIASFFGGPDDAAKVLKIKINVKNPYIVGPKDEDIWKLNNLIGGTKYKNDIEYAAERLQKLGYDALDARLNDGAYGLLVFDPKNVVVIP